MESGFIKLTVINNKQTKNNETFNKKKIAKLKIFYSKNENRDRFNNRFIGFFRSSNQDQ